MNIYGSTEIGADVCYAVLSEPVDITEGVRTEEVEGSGTINETDIGRSEADNQFPIYWTEESETRNTDISINIKMNRLEYDSKIIDTTTGIFFSESIEPTEICENVRGAPTDVQTQQNGFEQQTLSHRLIGKSPIGYAIDGNELFIVRVIEKEKNMDCGEKVNDNQEARLGEGTNEEDVKNTDSKSNTVDEFELVPDGIPGELLVGGSQIALGYHNRPDETNNRFILRSSIRGLDECSTSSGLGMKGREDLRKVFRTGDIVVRIPGAPPVVTSTSTCNVSSSSTYANSDLEKIEDKDVCNNDSDKVIGGDRVGDNIAGATVRQAADIISNTINCSKWPGALVWLGRSDLQVRSSRM